MACYVDTLRHWGWEHGQSSHLIADSPDELHAMAKRIGLKREWFQPKSSPHYDLTGRRRAAAVKAGAVELENKQYVAKLRELRAAAQEKKP